MKKKNRLRFLLPVAVLALSACSLLPAGDAVVQISRVHGGKLALLPETRNPVLVVKSPKGVGRARLQIRQALPEGMIIEFPGLQKLESFSLQQAGKSLVCHGTEEPELSCTWGNEWPVGSLRRYAGTMTVSIPAAVLATPGEWSLEWVDYYRN